MNSAPAVVGASDGLAAFRSIIAKKGARSCLGAGGGAASTASSRRRSRRRATHECKVGLGFPRVESRQASRERKTLKQFTLCRTPNLLATSSYSIPNCDQWQQKRQLVKKATPLRDRLSRLSHAYEVVQTDVNLPSAAKRPTRAARGRRRTKKRKTLQ